MPGKARTGSFDPSRTLSFRRFRHIQIACLRDEIIKIRGAERARLLEDDLSLLGHHERGDGLYSGGARQLLVLVDVDLREDDVGVLFAGLLEDGSEGPAGASPGGPEINEDDVVVGDGFLECLGGHGLGCHRVCPFMG